MKKHYPLPVWLLLTLLLVSSAIKPSSAQTSFGSVNVASQTSAIVTVDLLAPGTLGSISVLTQGALLQDFANTGGGTCATGITYPANATCTVKVTFSPENAGTEYGAVLLNDESGNLLASAFILGTGVGPQLVFLPGSQTSIGGGWVQPWAAAVDGAGNVYVANYPSSPNASGGSVVKETFSAGSYTQSTIGSGIVGPTGVAVDGQGNVYIVDSSSRAIYKETPSPEGYIQTQVPASGLALPIGIAVDAAGDLYITDAANFVVVKETVSGGSYLQSHFGSGLNVPTGIAVDSNGNVYVGDWGNSRVVVETPAAGSYLQSTVLGGIQETGGLGGSLAIDGRDNLYIAETSLNALVMYPWSGHAYGTPVSLSSLALPMGVAVASNGNVYFTVDSGALYSLDLADPPSFSFESTIEGTISSDSPKSAALQNIGNAVLTFPVPYTGANPSIPQNFTLQPGASSACPSVPSGSTSPGTLPAGSSCLLSILFTPTTVGTLTGSLTLTDNRSNAPSPGYATQHIALSGVALPKVPVLQWSNPLPITYGAALTSAQLNATANVAGTFIYSPPLGTILPAGFQSLSVVFTPNDTVNYTSASASVVLTVNQAVPSISWSAPAAITYGTPLSAAQLNATSPLSGNFNYSPAFGTVLSAGTQALSVTFSPADSNDYTTASASVSITVNKAIPSLAWTQPAAITYGTTLSANQLDATASVPGNFTYSPPAGSLLPAGTQHLSVTFNPTDAADYTPASLSTTLTVNQAVPAINWATPAAITYGTALSAAQLDASSTVAGAFAYSYTSGTVLGAGQQTLSVTFTPKDTADYTSTTVSVTLQVNQALPTIAWQAPSAITYGTALSAAQLNATSPVPGIFSYATPAGTVLTAGIQTLFVTFTPTDNVDYQTATASVKLTVSKALPSISWIPPSAISYGTPLSATQLDAGSSVQGTLAYAPGFGTILSAGTKTLSVTFTPADTVDYATTSASVSLTINKAVPGILWTTPAPIAYGTALSIKQLDAKAYVSGSISYSTPAGTILPAGSQTLSATFTPNDTSDYTTASASVTLTINQAVPAISWPTPANIVYGTPLGSTQLDASSTLPGTFSYSYPAGTVLTAGSQSLSVIFTPSDSADYATASASVILHVAKAQTTMSWATPAPITYGTALSAAQLDAQASVPGNYVYTALTGAVLSAGSHTISVAFTPTDSNDYSSASASAVLMVTKSVVTVSVVNRGKVYGSVLPGFTYQFTGLQNGDQPAHAVSGTPVFTTSATASSPVGSYPVGIAIGTLTSTNYTFLFAPGTLSITPAVLQIDTNNSSKVYGAPLPAFTYSIYDFVNGDSAASAVSGTPTLSTTATATSGTGVYLISATLGTLTSANYTFTLTTGTLTINRATLSITANNAASIYGSAIPGFAYSVAGLVNGDTASQAFSGSPSLASPAYKGSPAGKYPIAASMGTIVSNNYNLTYTGGALVISKAALTVVPANASAIYGAGSPQFTYQLVGFLDGDTPASAVTGTPSLSTAGGLSPAVGTYPIVASLGTLSAPNYSFSFGESTMTISKAVLTVTASTINRVYGSALPALSYTLSGFAYADNAQTATAGAPSLTTPATAASKVGTYTLTAALGSLTASNYTFRFASGSLVVNKAPLAVAVINQSIVYGSAIPVLTYQFNGLVNGDTAASALHGLPALSTTATLSSPAGSYPISISPGNLSATNYTFSVVPGTLQINKAVLTVTAINESIVQGSPIPVFDYTLSGFLGDESLANALTGEPTLSSTGTAKSAAGTYPIKVGLGTLAAQNYSFSLVNGVLTIQPSVSKAAASHRSPPGSPGISPGHGI